MKNRDKINALSNVELAGFLGNDGMKCSLCIYSGKNCRNKSCAFGIKAWLDAPSNKSSRKRLAVKPENPPTDNKSQGDIPPEVKADLKKIAEGFDVVNKPSHYVKDGMECIDFIRAIVSDLTPYEAYCLGNVVKYLWRFKDKNGVIDLDKAVRYIEFLKEAQRNVE